MATAAKDKPQVDHSAMSGAPPKVEAKAETKTEEKPKSDFLSAMQEVADKTAAAKPAEAAAPPPAPAPSKPPGILGMIQTGRTFAPPRILLSGTEGIGKSTFAARAPKTIFIPTEDGLNQIECAKFPLSKTFQQFRTYLGGVATEKHEFQTTAIDSVDWLERLIWDQVCADNGKKSIEDIGYAKGYTFALTYWRETLDLLERCHARGMCVILIAHTKLEKYEDPEHPTYDRHSPRLHKHAQALLTEWVDAVLFATRKMLTKKVDGDDRTIAAPIGAAGGERIIKTTGTPTVVAKNRYNLPPELPLDWNAFATALSAFYATAIPAQKSVA